MQGAPALAGASMPSTRPFASEHPAAGASPQAALQQLGPHASQQGRPAAKASPQQWQGGGAGLAAATAWAGLSPQQQQILRMLHGGISGTGSGF